MINDKEFLIWIYRRLVNIHNEPEDIDYIIRLKEIALNVSSEVNMMSKKERLENKWNDLDMERDHITEEMQEIRKEILNLQFKEEGKFVLREDLD